MHITREAYKIPSVLMSGWQMLLLDISFLTLLMQ